MALVLVYDFLFGHGLRVGGHFKLVMTRNKTSLNAALARMKIKSQVVHNKDLLPSNIQENQGEAEFAIDMVHRGYIRINIDNLLFRSTHSTVCSR